jgi:hypothetical protein
VPDPVEFSRWAADVERFVNSLVAAVFGVDLQTVATAQAVETEAIREHLERAEGGAENLGLLGSDNPRLPGSVMTLVCGRTARCCK